MLSRTLVFVIISGALAAAQIPTPKAVTAPAVAAHKALAEKTDKMAANVNAPAPVPEKQAAIKLGAKPAPAPSAPEMQRQAASTKIVAKGKRDPFISVIREKSISGPPCHSGKKCLPVNDIVLKGIVKGPAGMLALVENGQRKAYFLRVNDVVFNGQVLRITSDSIVFREKVIDRAGREMLREVVKRVNTADKPAA